MVVTASLALPTHLPKASTNRSTQQSIPTVNTVSTTAEKDGSRSPRALFTERRLPASLLRYFHCSPMPISPPASSSQVLRVFHMRLANSVSQSRPRTLSEPKHTRDKLCAVFALATTTHTFRRQRFVPVTSKHVFLRAPDQTSAPANPLHSVVSTVPVGYHRRGRTHTFETMSLPHRLSFTTKGYCPQKPVTLVFVLLVVASPHVQPHYAKESRTACAVFKQKLVIRLQTQWSTTLTLLQRLPSPPSRSHPLQLPPP
jgi:hypothetical protein